MTEWMDASILDENDPSKRDPGPDSGQRTQPPYRPDFLERATRRRSPGTGESPSGSGKLAELKASGRLRMTSSRSSCGTMARAPR